MKKIKLAAIKHKKTKLVYTGLSHDKIVQEVFKTYEIFLSSTVDIFGFVDTDNKFLTRYEAGIVAHKAGQTKKKEFELYSDMLDLEG
jgi:hypothetical protein